MHYAFCVEFSYAAYEFKINLNHELKQKKHNHDVSDLDAFWVIEYVRLL